MFQSGDVVFVSKQKLTFEKGYKTIWTEKLFIVTDCFPTGPPVYPNKDLLDESIKETFYPEELQKVQLKETIEKILQKCTRKTSANLINLINNLV